MQYTKYDLCLQLFADGDGVAVAEGAETAETNAEVSAPDITTADETGAKAADAPKEQTPEDLEAEFNEAIKGKYKDLFTKKAQSIIDRRFKETKTLQSTLDKVNPLLAVMAERLNVDPNDHDALLQAYKNDEAYIEHVALKEGMSLDDARQKVTKAVEAQAKDEELLRLRAERDIRAAEEKNRERFNGWMTETESLKAKFPGLDLAAELSGDTGKQFVSLLESLTNSGFPNPVEVAYETLHRNEIMAAVMTKTAESVKEKTAKSVAAAASRPAENGTADSAGFSQGKDVNSLTSKDIIEILKRVEKGDTISF